MVKTNLKRMMSLLSLRHLIMTALIFMAFPGIEAIAAEADVPEISYYYPWKMEDSPVEMKPASLAYVYFATGSMVKSAKAMIIQNDTELGTCTYLSPEGYSATLTMDPTTEDNAAMDNIPVGIFTLKFYEVTYLADGVEKTYSDKDNPIDEVTYLREKPDYKLVETKGLENRLIKSYYPEDGEDGVRTYIFDCALNKDKIKVYFDYGQGNTYIMTPLEWSINEAGNEITIDLRGKCFGVHVLAPDVIFRDDNGNPCDPPSVVSIGIDGLISSDGARVSTIFTSLDGTFSYPLTGRLYENFNYEDLTFETPELLRAEYFSSESPKNRFNNINESTDMMELYISNLKYIDKADVKMQTPTATEIVTYEALTVNGESIVVALPESIKAAGSQELGISLINVTFTADDGAEHVIAPLGSVNGKEDIISVAQLKEQQPGEEVVFNVVSGLKVTMSNNAGYTFAEDETGGLQIVTEDYSRVLNEGTMIQGKLNGTYLGNGIFMIDKKASDYTETPEDVTVGTMVKEPEDLTDEANFSRLITIITNEHFDIAYDADYGYIVINGYMPVVTDLIDSASLPSNITNVTGILYNDPNMNQPMLIVRSVSDFNRDLGSGITHINADALKEPDVYDLRGVKVHGNGEIKAGVYIVNGKKIFVR